jgi:hypothetical protein
VPAAVGGIAMLLLDGGEPITVMLLLQWSMRSRPRCPPGHRRWPAPASSPAAKAHVLASLAVLTLDQELLAQTANELANVAAADRPQPPVDRTAIEAKLKRLVRLYEDGFKTEAEYARERDALRVQLAAEGTPSRQPNRSSAVALLADVPQLLRRATLDERRAVLEEVLDVIYLMPHQAMAVRPVESYAPLLQAARLKIMGEWAGWAYSHRTRTRIAS